MFFQTEVKKGETWKIRKKDNEEEEKERGERKKGGGGNQERGRGVKTDDSEVETTKEGARV